MLSMRCSKGIIDIKIAERGQSLGKRNIVLLFTPMETQILEHGDAPGQQPGHDALGRRADAVLAEHDVVREQLAQPIGDHFETVSRIGATLRATEMRNDDDASAATGQILQSR